MYHETGLSALSKNQVSKILNGHPVLVKKGNHHKVHLSSEQHKKLHKNHEKGMGMKLTFDPYQIHNHSHLAGTGFFDSIKSIGHALAPIGQKIGQQLIDKALPLAVDYGIKKVTGTGIRRAGRPRKTHLAGHGIGEDVFNTGRDILGFGLKKHKKVAVKRAVKKTVKKTVKKHPKKKGGALMPAGYNSY